MLRQTMVVSLTVLSAWCCANVLVRGSDPETPKAITNSIGMRLRLIPAGEFMMGSPDSDQYAQLAVNEKPAHRVRITKPLYLGMHEVTVGQFRKFVKAERYRTECERDGKGGYGHDDTKNSWKPTRLSRKQKPEYTWRNPGFPQTENHPVVNVSWNDAVAFVEWLSRKERTRYRLPTEAEWEYACRAGTAAPHRGDIKYGYSGGGNMAGETKLVYGKTGNWLAQARDPDGHRFTAPVGQSKANRFGLYDMHGNVWEWCADWYDAEYYGRSPSEDPPGPASGSIRVRRGGSWTSEFCRAAARGTYEPSVRNYDLGFRLARTVSSPSPSR
jgi:formylglycine-generating enzyme required for sulfatase activity